LSVEESFSGICEGGRSYEKYLFHPHPNPPPSRGREINEHLKAQNIPVKGGSEGIFTGGRESKFPPPLVGGG